MLALAFLNPLLLIGLPLCAVPIVIHLLNRRRFHRVPWAAMEYLLAAMKRNRKRLRMEQWLVLLLRTLAVLLLVALVSRPRLGGGGGILSSRTHHVIVLDDSASMTQRSGSTTLFEKAQERVRVLVDDLVNRRAGDLVSVVRTSRPTTPEPWTLRLGPETSQRVTALQKTWTVGDGAPDLGAVLQTTAKRASEVTDAARTDYYLVSDQRARDWVTEDDKCRPSMLAALSTMRPAEKLALVTIGGQQHNLAVADVRLVDRLVTAGVPAALAIDVQNHGLDPTAPTTVAIEIDASRVVLQVPSLAPGERQALPISHTFPKAGFFAVRAQLEATEQFPLDDRRTLAVEVREKSRVLLVDGEPDEDDGETFYLQAAMDMPESGLEPVVVTDATFEETDLQPFDLVWLCNVRPPSPAACQRLEAWVAAGGGLVIACGSQIDATRYNELLWRDGKGVLPLPLGEIAGDPDKPEGAVLTAKDHPICAGVADVLELLVANVLLVKRWLSVQDDGQQNASIVIRTHDAEGPPLLLTRTYPGGGGEVALFTISADKFWSNLPSTDLFVVLCNQIHRAGARRRDTSRENLLPDGVYRVTLDPAAYRPDVTVRAALDGADEHTVTATEAAPGAGSLALALPMAELQQLGAYEVEMARHDGVPEKRLLARNPPPAESRLAPFPPTSFTRLYPAELHDRVSFVDANQGGESDSTEGELWPLLAAALVAGLLLESLLAWRFGRR